MLAIVIENKLLQQYLKHRLLINGVLLALLFFGNCFWANMVYLIYPFLLVLICSDNLANGITYLCFCVPFFHLKGQISVLLYAVCALVYIVKFYLVQYCVKKQRPKLSIVILVAVLLLYCLLPLGPYNFNRGLKILLFGIVLAILGIFAQDATVCRVQFNLRVTGLALIIASFYGILSHLFPYLRTYFEVFHLGGDFTRFKALFTHPNILAIACEVICALFAYFIITRKAGLIDYSIFLIVTMLGLLTFSKTFLVLIILIYLAIFIWLLRQDFAHTLTAAAVIMAVVVCLCTLISERVGIYFNRFVDGFSQCQTFTDFMNVITTYRFDLWTVYLNFLGTHPWALLFGSGLGAPALTGWSTLSAHNFFISLIYQLGLVGTGLVVALVVLLGREISQRQAQPIARAIWVPIIVFVLLLCVEDFILYIF